MNKLLVTAIVALAATLQGQAQTYGYGYGYGSGYGTTSGYGYGTTNSSVRYQRGYTRSDGTYVQGHVKTTPNRTNVDNFSTQGNVNIYTGTVGTRARDYSVDALNYGSGRTVYTGSRGGQYYINSNGNRTYVPKRW